jgi:tetratricopeptide (TPR) repeat protein
MACGLPVLVTAYGAALDFCDAETAGLIPARVTRFTEKRVGDLETVDFPHLAEPDADALADLLRQAVARPDEGKRRAEAALRRVLAGLTWRHVAGLAEQRLLGLRERPIRRLHRASRNGVHRGADEPLYVAALPPANGARPKLSVCLIVKDEEANLPACLDSLDGLGAEVVVCDTGSTDRTREIAHQRGAKVVEFPWIDHFAQARNASLEHATGEWVFWLDADDRLDAENREKLRALVANLPEANVAYSMKCRCLANAANGTETTVDHVRLFRNDRRIRWRYRVHEQILPAVRESGGEVLWSDVVIHHTGYSDPDLRQRKLQRDLRLLRLEQAEQPHDPFTLFNLGAVLQETGRHAEALPLLAESLARSHPRDSIVRKLYALQAGCNLHLRRPEEALRLCRQGLAVCPDDAELLFLEGLVLTEQGDFPGARASLVRLLGTDEGQHFASVADGLRSYRGRHQLAVVCFRSGEPLEAETLWNAVLRERPGFVPARVGLGELLLAQKRFAEVQEQAATLAALPGGELDAVLLRARVHLEREEFSLARVHLEESLPRLPGCLPLLSLLSYALLREDRDHDRAERLLREILARDPHNAQAKQNLDVLRRRLGGDPDRVFRGDVALGQLYHLACDGPSDLREHLPLLHDLARRSGHVTEFGAGECTLTTALLFAQPGRLVCFDRLRHARMDELSSLRGRTDFVFRREDVLWAQIEETDLLVIDTVGSYAQLHEELRLHAASVRRWIVVARTSLYGDHGEPEGSVGLWPAVEEFLARGTFRLAERREAGVGLTVLERVSVCPT